MEQNQKITVLGLCGNSVFMNVEHFHAPGETVHARGLYAEPGGKGYNQAVAAARQGAQVCFLGCIGNDADGRMCMEFLEQEGIRALPQTDPDTPSAYACILTDAEGENRVTVFQGAAQKLTPEFIREQEQVIAESAILLLNNEYPQCCNEAAVEIAKKHGVRVVYNPAPARSVSREFLASCELVTPNLSETAAFTGSVPASLEELTAVIRGSGIRRAVVTLGGDGAALIDGEQALLFPACPTVPVDTTGAGDTFTAALCAALLRGLTLPDSICWAANAAALSVSRKYVMPGLPTLEQVKRSFRPITPSPIG